MSEPLGIYIHIPFCVKKCNYCDFCSFAGLSPDVRDRYTDALCENISQWSESCAGHTVDTVYFGGGTPTLLTLSQFERIFSALRGAFDIADDAEISVECNPATADREYFAALRRLGVNRLSVGAQSSDDRELKTLGRVHSWSDFVTAFRDARSAGFDNISVDVMFGIPGQTVSGFAATLDRLTALGPEHISAYGLILEPGTPFYENRENLVFPDEDSEYTMYTDAVAFLSGRGYERYEISNFAQPDRQSRHNLKYWLRDEYLGFGASAHSFFGEKRFSAPRSVSEYISRRFVADCEEISRTDAANEFVMLAMRLRRGVDENEFFRRFGVSFGDMFGEKLERFVSGGFVVRGGGRCAFSDRGFYVSNSVLSEILSFDK